MLKEKGNDAFKAAAFEDAITFYSQAIDAAADDASPLALSCFNNRAACNQQLSNFSGVIRDCTHVLEHEPANQKALLRRALAYEGLERYPLALQDIRALNALNPNIEVLWNLRRVMLVAEVPGETITHVWVVGFWDLAGGEQGPAPSWRVRAQDEALEQLMERRVSPVANGERPVSQHAGNPSHVKTKGLWPCQ